MARDASVRRIEGKVHLAAINSIQLGFSKLRCTMLMEENNFIKSINFLRAIIVRTIKNVEILVEYFFVALYIDAYITK